MSSLPQPQGLKPISFHPDDCIAGGLINDVDVEIEAAEFTTEGPPGYTETALFCRMSLKELHSGEVSDQYWSCGRSALENFTPSDDGRFLLPTGGKTGLNRDCNFAKFMKSLTDKGFPKPLCQDLGNFRGLQMHVIRAPLKTSAGMSAPKDERERTILLCESILRLPGERTKRGSRAAVQTASVAGSEPRTPTGRSDDVDGEVSEMALEQLTELLTESGSLPLKVVRAKVYGALKSVPTETRNAVVRMVTDSEWLASHGFGLDGNGNVVSAF